MAADVVEAVDVTLAVFDQEEGVARDVELLEVPWFIETKDVGKKHPIA